MADTAQFLSIKKLKGRGIILLAARHNLRELQAELGAGSRIDAGRMGLNEVLAGAPTAAGVDESAVALLAMAGIDVATLAKNTVFGIETVISLPAVSAVKRSAYFADTLAFIAGRLPVPVLSAVIHNDESAPHLHVLLLPLVDGRMAGSDLLGGPAQFRALQKAFFAEVGEKHGLVRQKAVMRLTPETSLKFAEIIANSLDCPAIDDNPARLPALINALRRSPGLPELIESWGIPLPAGGRTFAEIMTATATPEKSNPIWFERKRNPIGLSPALVETPVKEQTISCVGFADLDAHKPPPATDDTPLPDCAESTPPTAIAESSLVRTTATAPAQAQERLVDSLVADIDTPTATAHVPPERLVASTDVTVAAAESPGGPLRKPGGRKPVAVDVPAAWRMRESGLSMNAIAEHFGCKKSALYSLMPAPSKTLAAKIQPGLWAN